MAGMIARKACVASCLQPLRKHGLVIASDTRRENTGGCDHARSGGLPEFGTCFLSGKLVCTTKLVGVSPGPQSCSLNGTTRGRRSSDAISDAVIFGNPEDAVGTGSSGRFRHGILHVFVDAITQSLPCVNLAVTSIMVVPAYGSRADVYSHTEIDRTT